jgi:hypothetical protein
VAFVGQRAVLISDQAPSSADPLVRRNQDTI